MKRHILQRLRNSVLVLVVLAATPVWAGANLYQVDFYTTLGNVDEWGCLDYCDGEDVLFNTVINTRKGTFTGTARGCVWNDSCRKQVYKNVGSVYADQLILCKSLYRVDKYGTAFFTGSGNVDDEF